MKLHKRIALDDKNAFREFFQTYYAKLIDFALLYLKNHSDAEDIVSEVFIKLLKNKAKLAGISNIEGYMFLMVKNHCLNFIQKNQYQRSLTSIENKEDFYHVDYHNPEQKYLENELRDIITKSVEKMPPRRKMIFQLIKEDGLKYKEVAELMDISPKTVENHLDLAIKSVRVVIEDYLKNKSESVSLKNIHRYLNMIFL